MSVPLRGPTQSTHAQPEVLHDFSPGCHCRCGRTPADLRTADRRSPRWLMDETDQGYAGQTICCPQDKDKSNVLWERREYLSPLPPTAQKTSPPASQRGLHMPFQPVPSQNAAGRHASVDGTSAALWLAHSDESCLQRKSGEFPWDSPTQTRNKTMTTETCHIFERPTQGLQAQIECECVCAWVCVCMCKGYRVCVDLNVRTKHNSDQPRQWTTCCLLVSALRWSLCSCRFFHDLDGC